MSAPAGTYLSFSRLSTWSNCGEQYRLRYIERVPTTPSGALIGGIAVHEAIERAEASRAWAEEGDDWADLLGDFGAALDDEIERRGGEGAIRWGGRKTREFPGGEDASWWRSQGPAMLRRYAGVRQGDVAAGWSVLEGGVERTIGAELPSGMHVTGRIDAMVAVSEDGEPVIRDWTTGRPGGKSPVQAATYAWALERAGVVTTRRAQYVYLRATDRARLIQDLDLTGLVPLVERLYGDVERAIAAELYPLRPGMFCASCDVAGFCDYGRAMASGEGGED